MPPKPKIEDLVGLGHTKLGFFKEVQVKIGELRVSNLELEQKRRQVQAILDTITDIVAVVTPQLRIRSVNNSFYDLYPDRRPLDDFCYRIFRDQNQPCSECPLQKSLAANKVCRQSAIIALDGKNLQFEITAAPLRDASGHPTDILIVKRDVTLEKQYQAKYYHAEKMATIGLLAAGVAHEINNPLAAIRGFAEGLRRRLPAMAQPQNIQSTSALFQEYLDIILTECGRCQDIVQSLLTFSPRKRQNFVPVELNQLIRNVLRLLQHRLKGHPPELIHLKLAEHLPPIQGLPAELEQVILNLVLNALDAITAKGAITIRTAHVDRQYVMLEVQDNGGGIAPEHLPKLFEPFFTTKPVGKGIGIGLSTCYHIIQAHDGDISARSRLGQGATFTVKIPCKQKDQ